MYLSERDTHRGVPADGFLTTCSQKSELGHAEARSPELTAGLPPADTDILT